MDDERITFLTEVELPRYCFVSEAIEWIAYGRVPQVQYNFYEKSDESVEHRFDWRNMPDNFQPESVFFGFDRSEFESLGIDMSDGYPEAAERCGTEYIADIPLKISEYRSERDACLRQCNWVKSNFYTALIASYQQKLDDFADLQNLVDHDEAKFRPYWEMAAAKIFPLLATGQIEVEGVDYDRWSQLFQREEYEDAGRFVQVPKNAFTLAMDWSGNEIVEGQIRYVALRLKTKEILENRSVLLQPGKAVNVERFGSFYRSSDAGRSLHRRRPGRSSKIDWSTLKNYLFELSAKGALPEGKEVCIFEIIAYAEQELKVSPSRTAVQRNMRRELDAHYARN